VVRRRTWGGFAVALLALSFGAGAVAQTPEDVFLEGNAHYENGRYAAAAVSYRNVLRYQIRDPVLEYNLANTEFRLGNLGQAILHYERALRLDPSDREIVANLDFARSFRHDQLEADRPAAVVRWVYLLQHRLGPDRQAWGVLAVVWLIAALQAWCFSRPGGWTAAHGWVLGALLMILAVACTSWYTTLQRLEGRRSAVVLQQVAEVLAGPGRNNPALFTVHEGLSLWIRGERDEWLQVSRPNGLHGWIPKDAVGEV
jgi:tetratricopeptide (TPR) repeat protein